MVDIDNMTSKKHGDDLSINSTDTYSSTESISRNRSLRESLPSHLFKEVRAMPSAKGARKSIRNTDSARYRRQGSARSGIDEPDFVNLTVEDAQNHREEIKHMATSLKRKKIVL